MNHYDGMLVAELGKVTICVPLCISALQDDRMILSTLKSLHNTFDLLVQVYFLSRCYRTAVVVFGMNSVCNHLPIIICSIPWFHGIADIPDCFGDNVSRKIYFIPFCI